MKTVRLLLAISLLTPLSNRAGEMPRAVFEKHCFDCHDATEKKGGLDLDALKGTSGNLPTSSRAFIGCKVGQR